MNYSSEQFSPASTKNISDSMPFDELEWLMSIVQQLRHRHGGGLVSLRGK